MAAGASVLGEGGFAGSWSLGHVQASTPTITHEGEGMCAPMGPQPFASLPERPLGFTSPRSLGPPVCVDVRRGARICGIPGGVRTERALAPQPQRVSAPVSDLPEMT